MIEPSALDDHRDRVAFLPATDRSMRLLESGVALIALVTAVMLALFPH